MSEKKGKWVHAFFNFDTGRYEIAEENKHGAIICSNCKESAYDDSDYGYQIFPYCPYCGAEMGNGGDDPSDI